MSRSTIAALTAASSSAGTPDAPQLAATLPWPR
jgi:hypothetical protein